MSDYWQHEGFGVHYCHPTPVAAFRRDIQISRLIQGVGDEKEMEQEAYALPDLRNTWGCPWVRLFCVHSGTAVPYRECEKCDFAPGALSNQM